MCVCFTAPQRTVTTLRQLIIINHYGDTLILRSINLPPTVRNTMQDLLVRPMHQLLFTTGRSIRSKLIVLQYFKALNSLDIDFYSERIFGTRECLTNSCLESLSSVIYHVTLANKRRPAAAIYETRKSTRKSWYNVKKQRNY